MAYNIESFAFSKRKNSTSLPSSTGGIISITLKNGANLISPVFTIASEDKPAFNYCKFSDRYYFVKSITNVKNNLWEVECEEDYLGSWKTEIGASEALILYATGGSDHIIDQRIATTDMLYVSEEYKAITNIVIEDTTYKAIVGITGDGSNGMYALTNSPLLPELLDGLDLWGATFQTTDDIFKQLVFGGSATGNLKVAFGIPLVFANSELGSNVENLSLGQYPCMDHNNNYITGTYIDVPIIHRNTNISIPWRYSDWRRHSPYTSLSMYIPFIGNIALDADALINDDSLDVLMSVCCTNGDISFQVKGHSSDTIVAILNSNIAIQLPFGNSGEDYGKAIGGLVTGVPAFITGVASAAAAGLTAGSSAMIGAGLTAMAGGIISGAKGDPNGNAGCGGSSIVGLDKVLHVYCYSKELVDSQANYNGIIGKPVMKKATINTYSGFVQTDGFEVVGAMLDDEREAINSMLDRGIYYE